uniref:Uncharacterized protein n=1 Tax=Hemiselmis andersenii TaxID=464988 RepID=A0A6U4HW73_HEMAN|mmetsp:Transcript_20685/g.47753  ORF Transcript_20685/g.47753 Transcript_20685/m.47753 type:complete len:196 (+) Transcript_20685:218-805(+)|eukprot:CAMPEP_0114149752 /NCGR_PEP_ID=MMETSP0043_2-20121206/22330_1 /TAXON_ID=464988 /ORGANISM="Hemiselmis andersenii, Strain CCMP644" /LENGTH=195 /DNA_ID=CAMNT_0001244423 /DNA_START=137 /DNA_END=724 /DNA_ORIENTATION=+
MPATRNFVPFHDRQTRTPLAGTPTSPATPLTHPYHPDPSSPATPQRPTSAKRIAHLLHKPTLPEPAEIDVKPYSARLPPAVVVRDVDSPGSSTETFGSVSFSENRLPLRSGREVPLSHFEAVADTFRNARMGVRVSQEDVPVEGSDMMPHDETALMIRQLKNPLTPKFHPDLAGVGHTEPVRRYYTSSQMYSQLF